MRTALTLAFLAFAVAGNAQARSVVMPMDDVPLATPLGVTFQEKAGRGGPTTILGNAKGMSLYTFDKDAGGKSACVDACATDWPVLTASADAKAFGDWSVITRGDGAKQWAYRGKPLYTHAKDEKPGDTKGDKFENVWNVVAYAPDQGVRVPPGVMVREIAAAVGWVFVNMEGKPLYTFTDDKAAGKPTCTAGACAQLWTPFLASQLSRTTGDFSVVRRADGVSQWAYKGQPVYTYTGDHEPGDSLGNGLDGKWRVAMLNRLYMPAGVTVWQNHFSGNNLATAEGMTLYTRGRGVGGVSGHSLRNAPRSPASQGRLFGTSTCDAECMRTWPPLKAAADAQPSGYWEIVVREDGTRQWVYGGFPVYLFTGDIQPGHMNGVDTYEFLTDEGSFKKFGSGGGALRGAAALVWVAASP